MTPEEHAAIVERLQKQAAAHSEVLSNEVDVLYRMQWRQAPLLGGPLTRLARHVWLEANALRTRGSPSAPVAAVDLLLVLVPYRSDHEALLMPIAEALRARGVRVAIMLSRGAALTTPTAIPILREEQVVDGSLYRKARKAYRQEWRGIASALDQMDLTASARERTRVYFQSRAWDQVVMERVLDKVRPGLILGLHFLERPGYLAAIDAASPRPRVLLLQHGLNFAYDTAEFKGANKMLLWGEATRECLPFIGPSDAIPVIVGNPKATKGTQAPPTFPPVPRILFLSTPDTPRERGRERRALAAFLEATTGWERVCRPHPAQDREAFAASLPRDAPMDGHPRIDDAIANASVVVGTESTAMLEAIPLGRPVIALFPAESSFDWARVGMPVAEDASALRAFLVEVLESPHARDKALEQGRQAFRALFGEPQGAVGRIVDVIEKEVAR